MLSGRVAGAAVTGAAATASLPFAAGAAGVDGGGGGSVPAASPAGARADESGDGACAPACVSRSPAAIAIAARGSQAFTGVLRVKGDLWAVRAAEGMRARDAYWPHR